MTYEIWGIEPGSPGDVCQRLLMKFSAQNFKDADEAIKFCLESVESLRSIGVSDVEIRIKP